MPESQTGFGLPEIPPTRLRSRNVPGRTRQRCRSGVRPDATRDRNRNAIPTDPHHGDCRCGSVPEIEWRPPSTLSSQCFRFEKQNIMLASAPAPVAMRLSSRWSCRSRRRLVHFPFAFGLISTRRRIAPCFAVTDSTSIYLDLQPRVHPEIGSRYWRPGRLPPSAKTFPLSRRRLGREGVYLT
jgi:hypothetical protein